MRKALCGPRTVQGYWYGDDQGMKINAQRSVYHRHHRTLSVGIRAHMEHERRSYGRRIDNLV